MYIEEAKVLCNLPRGYSLKIKKNLAFFLFTKIVYSRITNAAINSAGGNVGFIVANDCLGSQACQVVIFLVRVLGDGEVLGDGKADFVATS